MKLHKPSIIDNTGTSTLKQGYNTAFQHIIYFEDIHRNLLKLHVAVSLEIRAIIVFILLYIVK